MRPLGLPLLLKMEVERSALADVTNLRSGGGATSKVELGVAEATKHTCESVIDRAVEW